MSGWHLEKVLWAAPFRVPWDEIHGLSRFSDLWETSRKVAMGSTGMSFNPDIMFSFCPKVTGLKNSYGVGAGEYRWGVQDKSVRGFSLVVPHCPTGVL